MISVLLGLITLGLSWERLREHTSFSFIHWSLGVHADSDGLSFASNRTLFNSAYATLAKEDAPGILASAIEAVLGAIGSASNDVATYPNPFYKYGSETNNPVSDNSSLSSRGCPAKLALTPRFLRCLFSDDQHGQHRPRRRRRDQPEHVSPLLPSLPFHSRLVLTNADCLSLFSDPVPSSLFSSLPVASTRSSRSTTLPTRPTRGLTDPRSGRPTSDSTYVSLYPIPLPRLIDLALAGADPPLPSRPSNRPSPPPSPTHPSCPVSQPPTNSSATDSTPVPSSSAAAPTPVQTLPPL